LNREKFLNKLFTVLLAFLAAGLAVLLGWHGCQSPLRVPILHNDKLLDVQERRESTQVTWPKSDRVIMVIGLSNAGDGQTQADLAGSVTIERAGTNILTLRMTPETLVRCNWLEKYGLAAFIIEDPARADKRGLTLEPGVEYSLRIDGAPRGASLWLHYIRPLGWDLGRKQP
jgi:hypothetical protein